MNSNTPTPYSLAATYNCVQPYKCAATSSLYLPSYRSRMLLQVAQAKSAKKAKASRGVFGSKNGARQIMTKLQFSPMIDSPT